jgi:hypothetical protein
MFRGVVIVALLAGLALPATAAAARPGVTTGGVANLTDTSVSLNGSVNPKGKDTQYFFQYGLNKLYGAQTPATGAGAANGGSAVSVPVGALAPATRYHYRLVAVNADGTTLGGDRTFKTKVQPLGLTLKATPSSVPFGSASVISGQLIGTNGRGRQVQLQASAFPYTAGFANVGTPVVTSTVDGTFSFNSIPIAVNTQFRVVMPARPDITSPIVLVGAGVQVKTDTKKVDQGRKSKKLKFFGSITPAGDGAKVYVQKLRSGVWTSIASSRAQHSSASKSSFSLRVRIYKRGSFRVAADSPVGQYSTGAGRTIEVKKIRP